MSPNSVPSYDPTTWRLKTFFDAIVDFPDGSDSPRDYLERCLEEIARRESEVMAFAHLNIEGARAQADAATERYRMGHAMSSVDGLPIGIKDLIETRDMPTEFGSELFAGHRPIRDAAVVAGLRAGGAVLVGKTVTITFGGGDPAKTRNPHHTSRTPGGSSSGTAAVVGGAMLPAALGTHARGSTIRPASFCGAFALKPTYGAINRQGVFSAAESMDHLCTFAGSLSDMWIIARHMSKTAGGDPGHPGLYGGSRAPAPTKPARLIRLDTAGWAQIDTATKQVFEDFIDLLAGNGVGIFSREDDPAIAAYEDELESMPELWMHLYRFEMRWPMLQYRDHDRSKIPPRLLQGLDQGEGLTQEQYRAALVKRAYVRGLHHELASRADGFITLSSPGPAPLGMDQGSAIFNESSSVLGVPAISLPLLAVDGMPLGIQLQGALHGDERLTACARWIAETELLKS